MIWEATDQFGNLYVAESSAMSLDELRPDLESLCVEIFARHPGDVVFSIDIGYSEISAPDGNQVSHRMTVPWFENSGLQPNELEGAVGDLLRDCFVVAGRSGTIQGPWD